MSDKSSIPWLRVRLSVQMFMQFAIWGVWLPVLGNHLKNLEFKDSEVGALYATGALATMISPLIAGQIADRYFATQWFLGLFQASAGGETHPSGRGPVSGEMMSE